MSHRSGYSVTRKGRTLGFVVGVAALAVLMAVPADALEFSSSSGKFRLNLDTTLSWGGRVRLEARDTRIISPFEPANAQPYQMGTAYSVNGDDGNLNFNEGSLVSNTVKATIDLGMGWDVGPRSSVGFFFRGSGFYDFALMQSCCERTELTDPAKDWAGSRVELLDGYGWWQFPLGKGGGEIRVGRQVLNWGESTFLLGGLSLINPVDLSAIRVPGSELREAYRPQGTVWASFDLTQNLSVEGFYQYEFEPVEIDPPGTYFSTNDFVGRGGKYVFLAFASFPDTGETPPYIPYEVDHPFMSVPRSEGDYDPDDGGQYGLALRWFVPSFGGTEFGFYYVNFHSRFPTINGITGPIEGGIAAQQAAGAIYQFYGVPPGVSPQVDAIAQAGATDAYAATSRWFTAYPEDIKLYGVSWNTQLGRSGIAFQGELAYKQDTPLQVDDVELLFAALSPISPWLAATNQVAPGGVGFSTTIDGYRLHDVMQFQFTLTKIWSQIFGANQGVLVIEPGLVNVSAMPDKNELRYESAGTYTSGNPEQTLNPNGAHRGKQWEPAEAFADSFSWGYRIAGRLDYLNAIGAWSLKPRFAWAHDANGNTPGPGGPFLDGRTAFTLGIQAEYQNSWQIDISYTAYGGASRYNLINDRDFIGGFIKYSF